MLVWHFSHLLFTNFDIAPFPHLLFCCCRYDPLVQHLADLKEKRAMVLQTLNSCVAEEKKVRLIGDVCMSG